MGKLKLRKDFESTMSVGVGYGRDVCVEDFCCDVMKNV